MKRTFIKPVILLIIAFAAITPALAQDKVAEIDKLLNKYVEYGQFNGTVLVAEKGKVIYRKGIGMANMEWGIPNKPDTKFRIGSVTKQFTAALILQLAAEGKIKLDGKLTDYLTDYRKDTGERVTIHQLLNHTSGIPSYTNQPGFFQNVSRNPYTVEDFVKQHCSGDLEFEPGSRYAYNNSGYFLLGAIIEKVTDKSYEEVLKERILDPLGMKDTGYDHYNTIIKNRAQGYQRTADGYENAPYLDMGLPFSAGSMYSTVDDLFKWDQALYGEKVLSAESKAKMFTPGLDNYGYGFVIADRPVGKTDKKTKVIQHGGGINGFSCLFTRMVDDKNLIVVLDNVGLGRFHGQMTVAIGNILYGQPYDMPKLSITDTLADEIRKSDTASAIALYRKLKKEQPDKYDFRVGELNSLGYRLIAQQKVKDAIEIFKLNVEMFPEASNPYDSLGEAYLTDGNKELALKFYKKSVELNPENTNGIEAIKRIESGEADVDPAVLESYVGEYQLGPGFIFTVTVEDGTLMGQATGQPKVAMTAQSETVFVISIANAKITFEKDESGKVTGLMLNQAGRDIPAKKIK